MRQTSIQDQICRSANAVPPPVVDQRQRLYWLARAPVAQPEHVPPDPRPPHAAAVRTLAVMPRAARPSRLLILDGRSDDFAGTIAEAAGRVQMVLLDTQLNGVQQIVYHLNGRPPLNELLIASADTTGKLCLGATDLTVANLYAFEDDLRRIGTHLAPGGRLRLLGRGARTDRTDQALLVMLARMTGVIVEATPELAARAAAAWPMPWAEPLDEDKERSGEERKVA